MADKLETGDQVKWDAIRELAEKINNLYDEKGIDGMRVTDPFANKYAINEIRNLDDASAIGYVNLMKDITSPFLPEKLGEEGGDTKYQLFEFAYKFIGDPEKDPTEEKAIYKQYMDGTKKPVLVAQYLVYAELLANDNIIDRHDDYGTYTTDALREELDTSLININCLIESRRDKVRKFWDRGKPYSEKPTVAAELYSLIEDASGDGCHGVVRFAYAGRTNNGNGNSIRTYTKVNEDKSTEDVTERPAPWVDGYIGQVGRFLDVEEDPWQSTNDFTLTFTGTKWTNNLQHESPDLSDDADGMMLEYTPPPIGCCTEFTWPTIGEEGGGKTNVYSSGILTHFTNWADWRTEYRKELTEAQKVQCMNDTLKMDAKGNFLIDPEDIPDTNFPAWVGINETGADVSAYKHILSKKSLIDRYQRWVQFGSNIYLRLVPMEFYATPTKMAYLTVPVSLVVVMEPKSYQTAIRKRWYDMLYYTLRNIAGYKYIEYKNAGSTEPSSEISNVSVIGVTWNKVAMSALMGKYILDYYCQCDRWKLLDVGNFFVEGSLLGSSDPFVGTRETYLAYSVPSSEKNVAQMWQWDESRYKEAEQELSYDNLFMEPYFEYLLCYKQEEYYNDTPGGFENEEFEDKTVCPLKLNCYHDITLPWDGGGQNTTCDTSYATHAFSVNVLNDIADYIFYYKYAEPYTRNIEAMAIGECHSIATKGTEGMTFLGMPYFYMTDYQNYTYQDEDGYTVYSDCVPFEPAMLTLYNVPAYYETLANTEAYITAETPGAAIPIEIDMAEEAFGYSSYIWKAIDPGGATPSNVIVYLTRWLPSLAGSLPTVANDSAGVNPYPDNYYGQPLDGLNGELGIGGNAESEYNTLGAEACAAWNRTLTDDGIESVAGNMPGPVWSQMLTAASGTDKYFLEYNLADYYTTQPLWYKYNEELSIGDVDIYLAPYYNSDGEISAKLLGRCHFSRYYNPEATEEDGCQCYTPRRVPKEDGQELGWEIITDCDTEWDGLCEPGVHRGSADKNQRYSVVPISNVTTSSGLISAVITNQPDGSGLTTTDYLKTEITIPYDMLSGVKDQRKKYLVVAMRSSNSQLGSWFRGYAETPDATVLDLKSPGQATDEAIQWATRTAGAARYTRFSVGMDFKQSPSV